MAEQGDRGRTIRLEGKGTKRRSRNTMLGKAKDVDLRAAEDRVPIM